MSAVVWEEIGAHGAGRLFRGFLMITTRMFTAGAPAAPLKELFNLSVRLPWNMIELLKEIRKKDRNAVTLLYNRYGKKLYGYAVAKWKVSEDEAWELIYKTLYKVMEVADRYTFEDEKKFAGFIFQAFVNNLRNHYHEKKRKPAEMAELNERIVAAGAEEQEEPVSSGHMKLLREEMELLEDWKKILLLMRAQDFSYAEIARYVNKPEEQLKVYYLRLKKQLTEKISARLNNKN